MSELFVIEFDKMDGYLKMELEKGSIFITAKDNDTYYFGRIFVKDARDIGETKESSFFVQCDNSNIDKYPKGFKELKDVVFIHYQEEGTGYIGFILLGQERKIVIELSIEDYKDFKTFLSTFLD